MENSYRIALIELSDMLLSINWIDTGQMPGVSLVSPQGHLTGSSRGVTKRQIMNLAIDAMLHKLKSRRRVNFRERKFCQFVFEPMKASSCM